MIIDRFPSSDSKSSVHYQIWDDVEKPVCVLQLIHGMTEYIDRYRDLAAYLNKSGIILAGDDHIGHGHTSAPDDWGYFGEQNGWLRLVDDEEKFREILQEKYPGVPFVMMGHSMGSFICRSWLSMYGNAAYKAGKLNGCIICGTAGSNPALGPGLALAKLIRSIKGSHYRSKLLSDMAFGSYLKGIENPKTPYDWLSHDAELVDVYAADPMCTFTFTVGGFIDLFTMLRYISGDECYSKLPKELCYLVVAGLEDPVGGYGKGIVEVRERMDKAGCKDVSQLLYEGMRHEIHNETDKEIVWEDLRDFCLDMAEEAAE